MAAATSGGRKFAGRVGAGGETTTVTGGEGVEATATGGTSATAATGSARGTGAAVGSNSVTAAGAGCTVTAGAGRGGAISSIEVTAGLDIRAGVGKLAAGTARSSSAIGRWAATATGEMSWLNLA